MMNKIQILLLQAPRLVWRALIQHLLLQDLAGNDLEEEMPKQMQLPLNPPPSTDEIEQ